ncbi:hypothetical protein SPHINGOR109_30309 [Sphingorhabdus sp. 109]|nr:hypothetical protein SPHINGOR109_30309 [Sphingorhabdus sp. 109]
MGTAQAAHHAFILYANVGTHPRH